MQFEPLRVGLGIGKMPGDKLLGYGALIEKPACVKVG